VASRKGIALPNLDKGLFLGINVRIQRDFGKVRRSSLLAAVKDCAKKRDISQTLICYHDGMTVDPLWDSIVTSGNLPVRKLRGSLDATRDTKSGTNDHHDES
jgi:hypothetical protein